MTSTEAASIDTGARPSKSQNPLLKVDVTETLKIADLKFHEYHKFFTGDAVTVDLDEMVESIKQNGFLEPITVLPRSKIVIDGFHRVKAAKKAGLKSVPARNTKSELTDEQVFIVMYESLVHRKHMTKKQQVALWVAPYGGEESFKARYKRGKGPAPEGADQITNEAIARRFGVKANTVSKYINQVLFREEPDGCSEPISDTDSVSAEQPPSGERQTGSRAQDSEPNKNSGFSEKSVLIHVRKAQLSDVRNSDDEHVKKMLQSAFRIFAEVLERAPDRYERLIELQLNRLMEMIKLRRENSGAGGVS